MHGSRESSNCDLSDLLGVNDPRCGELLPVPRVRRDPFPGTVWPPTCFAGQWSERCKSAATPFQGTGLYELLELGEVPRTAGHLRQAGPRDRSLMILWTRAFQDEIGESANDTERRVDRALAAGQIWLWDQNGETTSMAVGREPAQGVVRLSGVYTPPEKRKYGYGAACGHVLSKHLRDGGYRCILFTDFGNPTSNSIYRRIGYKAVAEALRYRFD